MYDGEIFEHNGLKFKVELIPDYDFGPPWEDGDGHGNVRWIHQLRSGDKRPGEKIIFVDGYDYAVYDVEEATARARREGWDAPPYGGTAGEKAARAVESEIKRFRDYLFNRWCYVGLKLTLLDDYEDEIEDATDSIWGMASDDESGLKMYAEELAEMIADRLSNAA